MSAVSRAVPGERASAQSAADAPRSLREAGREFAGHASPRILAGALLVALVARLAWGDWSAWDLVPPLVIAALWPLQEWAIHVLVLHFRPRRIGQFELDFRVPREHRAHHRDPWNLAILFIPAHSFLYTLPILVGLALALTPTSALALTAIAFHLALALHYEWVHMLVHTRVVPRTRLYRRLFRNHRWHHFKNEHYWYGVTMLSGDRLLGTAPDPERVPRSPTARTLEPLRPDPTGV